MAKQRYELSVMQMIYNAWFVVDKNDVVDPAADPGPANLQVNLFVRPGREPELSDVSK